METRDWLNTIEPRNVRAVMKRVVEDITAIDSLVIIWEFLSTVVSMTITRLFNTKILKYQRTYLSSTLQEDLAANLLLSVLW